MKQDISVSKITDPADLQEAFAIRYKVFVEEQGCPPTLEQEYDEVTTHFLATVGDVPAGASRWRRTELGYKLERFAVLREFRGVGVGQALVKAVLADLPADAIYIYLNAQTQVTGLYAKFGFETSGPEFEEAGIKHYKMVLKR